MLHKYSSKMRTIVYLIALAIGSSLIGSCKDRAEEFVPAPMIRRSVVPNQDPQDPPADPGQGNPENDPPKDPEPATPAPRPADSVALEALGLRPLDLAPEAYPAMIFAEPLAEHKGDDELFQEALDEFNRVAAERDEPLLGFSRHSLEGAVFWGYEIPRYLSFRRTSGAVRRGEHISGFFRSQERYYEGDTFGGVVGTCVGGGSYDSLRRVHNDYWATPRYSPYRSELTPYDLRHIRISSAGVDISPMFAFAYDDYRPVIEGKKMNLWRREAVRASEVGMHELDWIRGGKFWLIPLTDDYQDFTVHFVLRDGSVISAKLGKG